MPKPSPMPADTFWTVIDGVARVQGEPHDRIKALTSALKRLSLDDIIAFHRSGGVKEFMLRVADPDLLALTEEEAHDGV